MKSHQGTVVAVEKGSVKVKIEAISACATCESHTNCGFAEKKDKIIEIDTSDWQHYKEGDIVTISIKETLGMQAVFTAYILPSILAIVVFIILYNCVNELWTVLGTLLTYAIYIAILYTFRHRLQKKFTFVIS